MERFNHHHTQFPRAIHMAIPELRSIRSNNHLIIPMEIGMHEELHREVAQVPPLSIFMARRAMKGFNEFGNSGHVQNVQNYMRSIERAMLDPRTTDLERGIGALAIHANELQLPFIKAGSPSECVVIDLADRRTIYRRNHGKKQA